MMNVAELQFHEDEKEFAELKAIIKKKIGFNCDQYKQAHLKRRLAVRVRANYSNPIKIMQRSLKLMRRKKDN